MYICVSGDGDPTGPTSPGELALVIDLLNDNPFSRFETMELEYGEEEPFDPQKIVGTLPPATDKSFRASSKRPFNMYGSVSFDEVPRVVNLEWSEEYNSNPALPAAIVEYLQRWRTEYPNFLEASTSADDRENEYFFDRLALLPVPDCFGTVLGWCHVLSPRGYEKYYQPADLRHAPAYRVEEFNDGTFALMTYAHPLEFATEENTRRLVELTKYLYDRWQANGGNY